ncbi:hypothetical protein HNY73_003309 [Argiope bruennichi]|uniref:Uncharacterized protein n=1 Tax=Argiope bruennichi TaxID=94029 RepID=A0A8T0FWF4_ARGBR|nr:hypothetical protein HNY73_003309 [Argiope bruennichi]
MSPLCVQVPNFDSGVDPCHTKGYFASFLIRGKWPAANKGIEGGGFSWSRASENVPIIQRPPSLCPTVVVDACPVRLRNASFAGVLIASHHFQWMNLLLAIKKAKSNFFLLPPLR